MQVKHASSSSCSFATALATLLIVTVVSMPAHAQWTVSYLHPPGLHPPGATQSYAMAGSGTTQVGYTLRDGVRRACRWSGSADSWVDLNPEGSVASAAYAISGSQVGGWAWGTAALWSGSSVVGLNGATVYGVSGTHQVGYYVASSAGYIFHALLWSGTPDSRVDLNPSTATSSFAYGVFGTQQVGSARSWEEADSAVLWYGTAASWVGLNPAGASSSFAFATSGTHQVGSATFGDNNALHAGLWSGTAASWVDLHPAGATSSEAYSVSGAYQAGYANFGASQTASLWSGTAASWEDLSLALTGSWSNTVAQSVWIDGATLYVAGSGHNNTRNRDEALLWSRPLPCAPLCVGDINVNGSVGLDDLAILLAHFGVSSGATCSEGDTHPPGGDGAVDLSDLTTLLAQFGQTCP
jgi:hypothetical protein